MRCHFIAEYEDGLRSITWSEAGDTMVDVDDVAAAGRECRRRLESRPLAHRVEAWSDSPGWPGARYLTRATRGVEVPSAPGKTTADVLVAAGGETVLAVLREQHGPLCFCAEVCMPTPRDEDETKGEAT